jgi:hypothetical protein
LMQLLYQEGININNAYGFVLESSKKAVFVVDVDQMQKTEKLLKKKELWMFKCSTNFQNLCWRLGFLNVCYTQYAFRHAVDIIFDLDWYVNNFKIGGINYDACG